MLNAELLYGINIFALHEVEEYYRVGYKNKMTEVIILPAPDRIKSLLG